MLDGVSYSELCPPPDHTGCGPRPLKKAFARVAGYDSKHIRVDLERPPWAASDVTNSPAISP